jgi:hypothetical protein
MKSNSNALTNDACMMKRKSHFEISSDIGQKKHAEAKQSVKIEDVNP